MKIIKYLHINDMIRQVLNSKYNITKLVKNTLLILKRKTTAKKVFIKIKITNEYFKLMALK